MAKMFYTAEEAASKLGVTEDGLKQMVSENKLREFRDGSRVMFKVDQVDKIVGSKGGSTLGGSSIGLSGSSAGGIGLSDSALPMSGTGKNDAISLADSDIKPAAKEDTVSTGAMFDSGAGKSADSGAQTQIQSAIDDQLSLEGVGSGSGLLDLTRESDDTSLGAELLDEIYPGGDSKAGAAAVGSSTGIFESPPSGHMEGSGPSGLENMAGNQMNPVGIAEMVDAPDATSGAFGGMAFAAVLTMGVGLAVLLAVFKGVQPSWMDSISEPASRIWIFAGVLVVVGILFAIIGYAVGKATSK